MDIPDEITLMIFKKMDFHELMQIRDSCRDWRRIVQDNSLFKSVEIDARTSNIEKLMEIMENNGGAVKQLKFLELRNFEKYQLCISLCTNIKSFTIDKCRFENKTDNCETELLNLITTRMNLKRFVIKESRCISEIDTLVKALCHFKLEYLCISYQSGHISGKTLNKLHVNELKIKFTRVGIRGISPFCANNAENLTSLKLFVDYWSRDPDDRILEPLRQCVNLNTLILGGLVALQVTDRGLAHLHGLKLKEFEIWYGESISADGYIRFFDNMPMLRKIGLCHCHNIDTAVFRKIVQSCKELQKLKFWKSIDDSQFTKEALMIIAKGAREIRTLRLRFVSKKIGRLLHILPKIMPNLDEIEYWGVQFTQSSQKTTFINLLKKKIAPFKVVVVDTTGKMVLLRCIRSYSQLKSGHCDKCIASRKF